MAQLNFLDKTGLSQFWNKVKGLLDTKANKATTLAGYGITDGATKTDVTNASVEDRKWANITGKPLNYNPAGTVIWFSGKTLPSGYLVCNGQSLKKATYANLFNAIGYTYGGSGDNFNVPNLSDGNGRFIRATTDFSKVGTKQDDAIRNITGYCGYNQAYYATAVAAGAFSRYFPGSTAHYTGNSERTAEIGLISFDANIDNSQDGNPMAGHANGADIHPYNISLVPLISY